MSTLAPDGRLVSLFSEQEIAATVMRLASELDRDYRDRSPVVVGVLNGAFIFLGDLVRQMKTPLGAVQFLRLSSYGPRSVSSGQAKVSIGVPAEAVAGQDVVLVDDIVDTGITTTTALRYLRRHRPASVELCALLNKPSRRQVPVNISYLGFTVPDRFVVGYGLDLNQKYRQLPGIYTVEE